MEKNEYLLSGQNVYNLPRLQIKDKLYRLSADVSKIFHRFAQF